MSFSASGDWRDVLCPEGRPFRSPVASLAAADRPHSIGMQQQRAGCPDAAVRQQQRVPRRYKLSLDADTSISVDVLQCQCRLA